MTIVQILAVLIVGITILLVGIVKKEKWAMIISAIPLLIALSQIAFLLLMSLH